MNRHARTRSSHRAALAAALAISGVGAAAPGALAVPGPWVFPPVTLSAAGDAFAPHIAVAPDGAASAVWQGSDGVNSIVRVATRPPGGAFAAPLDLSAPGVDCDAARVGVAADGTTVVAWRSFDPPDSRIDVATRPPGGAFSAPVAVPGSGDPLDMRLAVAPDGTTVVAWLSTDGLNTIARSSTRSPGGAFGPRVDLSADGQGASVPQVAAGPDNTITAVWARSNGAHTIVQSATRPAGGAFGAALNLSAPGGDASNPDVAAGADGTTSVAWSRSDGVDGVVQVAERPPGGAFGAAVDVTGPGVSGAQPQVGVAEDATTTVAWLTATGGGIAVQAAARPGGGAFGTPAAISPLGQIADQPRIAAAPDGSATVAWLRTTGANAVVQAATRAPGAAFGPFGDLSAGGQDASAPALASGPDGSAVAVWARSDGAASRIQGLTTANPPALRRAPLVSGAPALGALLGCDGGLWTGAVTVATAWLRGLAEVASSPGYSVSAPDQGSALACRARASNPFGTVEATGAPVAIPTAAAAAAPAPVPSPGPAPAPAPTPGPPSARSLPAIRGSARVGRTLTCRPARFAGATRTTTAWLRGGKAIPKATKTRYKLTRRDRRRLVTCRTAATGPGGRSTVVSFGVLVR